MGHLSGEHKTGRRRVVKLYQQIRTAHLERALASDDSVTFLYEDRRYDFDEAVARQVALRRAGSVGALVHCLTHDVDVIETNEPLAWLASARGAAAVVGNRLRALALRRDRALVVSYAIENKDPRTWAPTLPLRARFRWYAAQPVLHLLWRLTDRVAFGTEQALELHRNWFSPAGHWPEHRVIPALPARPQRDVAAARPPTLVFLGDLSARKGFDLLLAAWPRVKHLRPDTQLVILGKGVGASQAVALAQQDRAVSCHIDPSRELIREVLDAVKVLVLPSQPTPRWREQVGLPIVEGLEAGCVIVATDQTGLSPWLAQHNHVVLPTPTDPQELTYGVVRALDDLRDPSELTRALPPVDGRQAAEDWLFGAVTSVRQHDGGTSKT